MFSFLRVTAAMVSFTAAEDLTETLILAHPALFSRSEWLPMSLQITLAVLWRGEGKVVLFHYPSLVSKLEQMGHLMTVTLISSCSHSLGCRVHVFKCTLTRNSHWPGERRHCFQLVKLEGWCWPSQSKSQQCGTQSTWGQAQAFTIPLMSN